jgi:LPXTG-site transpeptidase (sortase) family protein
MATKLRRLISTKRLPYVIAFGFILAGSVSLVVYYGHKHQAQKPITINPNATVNQSTNNPSEGPVKDSDFSNVPADQPKQIILGTIHAKGYIQKVATDSKTNQVGVPSNVNVAGWYTESVKPGQAGLSVIDGHVSGKYTDGIFKHLGSLEAGDTYQIVFGDNSIKTFKVRSVQTLPIADAGKILLTPDPTIKSQLNLITCGGSFNKQAQQYDKRTIVISELALP